MVGVTLDGVPAGIPLNEESFAADLARRKSGKRGTTPRKESDAPHLVSGVFNGFTTGAPLTVVFYNENTLSGDYRNLVTHPRPSHADWVAMQKYKGFADYRGGGHFSGRLTLGLVTAGVVAKLILNTLFPQQVNIQSSLNEVGGCNDPEKFAEIIAQMANDVKCVSTSSALALAHDLRHERTRRARKLLLSLGCDRLAGQLPEDEPPCRSWLNSVAEQLDLRLCRAEELELARRTYCDRSAITNWFFDFFRDVRSSSGVNV